ncbi:MAG TPA: hydroxyisourate hydrolase [Thermoanaerobaculia bacterium]|nr:hydroxyisourate hydrolase [Thermoanaerobaculia bacterium]
MSGGITTHVLDISLGRPAAGVAVTLEMREGGAWRKIGEGKTDGDGRLRTLVPSGEAIAAGTWRLTFEVGAYFRAAGREAFFPEVAIAFEVRDAAQHYHVPLLLSPYGYSTYRGS